MYEKQKRYQQKKARQAADVGDIPPVKNPTRRDACRRDLFRFLTTYFPFSTGLSPFSEDHQRVIERIQRCTLLGGLFVNAVYRGFAKTTISENALVWALLYGHRKFGVLFGADAGAASGNIDSIQIELSENDLLYDDFPEVCHPIRALEGKPQRCASQTVSVPCPAPSCSKTPDTPDPDCERCRGTGLVSQLTHIEWTADRLVLPHIPGSVASGSIIAAKGITAASRGLKYKRPDGVQQRPDFLLIDDPQTDASAATPHQVAKRLNIIKKSILKLGGHNRRIAAVMNATIIQPDDMVEQLLDPRRNAAWQGERIKMVKRFADAHDSLWLGDYARLRTTYDAQKLDDQERAHREATAFYKRNRKAMDAGCIVSWQHCFDQDTELSAIQHAYNCLIDDGPEVFASECQNEPLQPHADSELLKPHEIASKTSGLPRGLVPLASEHLTCFIDVQGDVLYWMVCAWETNFTGGVIDYGTFPDQPISYFSMAGATHTLKKSFPNAGLEARIYAGLGALEKRLLDREWKREGDGAPMRISRCLIDANWGKSTKTVNEFCRRSPHAALLLPSHGKYVGAASIPWEHYTRKEGERLGHHWLIPALKGKASQTRHVLVDVNFWKSFIHTRLTVPLGDRGCLSLFSPVHGTQAGGAPPISHGGHQLLSEHLTAEYRIVTEGRGRKVDEWKSKGGGQDNHWFDCLVGNAAAASIQGCDLMANRPPAAANKKPPRRRVSYLN